MHLFPLSLLLPPSELKSRFLRWRLTVALRTYMQLNHYVLRHANVTSGMDADGKASIGIRYNHKALYPDDDDASTHYQSTGSLQKDVERDTKEMLREAVGFVRESGGLHLMDYIEINCFHGVVQSSAFVPFGGKEVATRIYATRTTFEGDELKETTEITENLLPKLRIRSSPF